MVAWTSPSSNWSNISIGEPAGRCMSRQEHKQSDQDSKITRKQRQPGNNNPGSKMEDKNKRRFPPQKNKLAIDQAKKKLAENIPKKHRITTGKSQPTSKLKEKDAQQVTSEQGGANNGPIEMIPDSNQKLKGTS